MKSRIGIQLYTLREEMAQDVFGTLEKIAALGYEGVEFAGFFDVPAETMKMKLEELGLSVIGSHTSLDSLEDCFEEVVAYNKIIGNKNLICPWSDARDKESLEQIVAQLSRILPKIKAVEMTLLYHNHDHELVDVEGDDLLTHMVQQLNGELKLEVDTFWVYRAGLDPVEYMRKHKEIITLIHVKDGTAECLKALGEGTAPIQAILTEASNMGIEWVVVENDEPLPTGLEDCRRSINYLKKLEY